MDQFTADIAGMLELFTIAAGFVQLHRASKEVPAKLLKAASWVLIVGGFVVGACTTFYWFRYQSRGDFDTEHMGDGAMMHASETGMGHGMMGATLKSEGFGVLSEIDVKATLKMKLDVDFRRYVILGACNPNLAHRALVAEPQINLLLPCSVMVQEAPEGDVVVSFADPQAMCAMVGNPPVSPIAAEVIDQVGGTAAI